MCPMCESYNVSVYDTDHWKCRECGWIFLKEGVGKGKETEDVKETTEGNNARGLETI